MRRTNLYFVEHSQGRLRSKPMSAGHWQHAKTTMVSSGAQSGRSSLWAKTLLQAPGRLVHLVMVGSDPVARLSPVIRNEPDDCIDCTGRFFLSGWSPSARRPRLGDLDFLDPKSTIELYVFRPSSKKAAGRFFCPLWRLSQGPCAKACE